MSTNRKPWNDLVRLTIILFAYLVLGAVYFLEMLKGGIPPVDSFIQYYPLRLYYSINPNPFTWLPYMFLGMPFLGILQGGLFYPFNLAFLIADPYWVFQTSLVVHYVMCAFFTFLCARTFGISTFSSFVAGLIFAFSGFMIAHKEHTTVVNAAVWLPLLLMLYEKIRTTGSIKFCVTASLVVAIQVFAGHYQTSIYSYVMLGVFTIFHLWKGETAKRRLIFAGLAVLPIFLGSIIAMPQILATKELSDIAARKHITYSFFTEYSFHPLMFLQMVSPLLFGTPTDRTYWGVWNLVEMGGFVGTLTLSVALWTIIKFWRKNSHVTFLLLVSTLAIFLMLGRYNPLYYLTYHIPVYNLFRCPARHLMELDLALSMLLGFGLDAIITPSKDRVRNCKEIVLVISIIVYLFLIFALGIKFPHSYYSWLIRTGITTIVVPITFMCCYMILVYLIQSSNFVTKRFYRNIVLTLLMLTCFIECFSFGSMHDADYYSQERIKEELNSPIMDFLKRNASFERSVFINHKTIPLYNLAAGVQTLNGYEQLIPREFSSFLDIKSWGVSSKWKELIYNNISLSLLNVRYIAVPKDRVQYYGLDNVVGIDDTSTTELFNIPLEQWEITNANVDGNKYILFSHNNTQVSMISQIVALTPGTYLIKFDAKANGAWNNKYFPLNVSIKSPRQNTTVDWNFSIAGIDAQEDRTATFWFKFELSDSVSKQDVLLMIFTSSKVPIIVENIELFRTTSSILLEPRCIFSLSCKLGERSIYKRVFETFDWVIFENTNCFPRAFFIKEIKPYLGIDDMRFKLGVFAFNPSDTALVKEKDIKQIGQSTFGRGVASIRSYSNNHIVIHANVQGGNGFLVLSDQYFPGWKSRIDGKNTKIYEVYGMMRGVIVPEGEHIVEFIYSPTMIEYLQTALQKLLER